MFVLFFFPLVFTLSSFDDLLVFDDFSLKSILVALLALLYLCNLLLFQDQSYLALDFTHKVLSRNHLSFCVCLNRFYRGFIFYCWKLSATFDLFGARPRGQFVYLRQF